MKAIGLFALIAIAICVWLAAAGAIVHFGSGM